MKRAARLFAAALGVAALAAGTLTACGSSTPASETSPQSQTVSSPVVSASGSPASSSPAASASSSPAQDAVSGPVVVFAAASLKASFDEIAAEFEAAHPGVDVQLTYDGSATLVTQLQQGAPADVFASADEATMAKVPDLITAPKLFATNTLQIAVAPGNPKKITDLAGLAAPGVVTVLCAAQVPCGAAAHQVLDLATVDLTPASEEQSVSAVLTRVANGEADAGLVYRTDVAAADGKVDGVDFPQAPQVVNTYPIGVSTAAQNPTGAATFVEFVISDKGQQVLSAKGFGAP